MRLETKGAEHVPSALERLVVFAFANVLLIPLSIIQPYLATIFLSTIIFYTYSVAIWLLPTSRCCSKGRPIWWVLICSFKSSR